MRRCCGGAERACMTARTRGAAAYKLHLAGTHRQMTRFAGNDRVGGTQRKSRQLMHPGHGRTVHEGTRCMAAGAVGPELTFVDVAVTGGTGGRGLLEVERLVAALALRLGMRTAQRERAFRMTERPRHTNGCPASRAVARAARLF